MQRQRCAIVGTFSTWKQCPFNDPSLYVVGLNDAYTMGIPRADEWYDIHPLDHMWFRGKHQKIVNMHDVPKGHFVRPEGHIEWLKTQARTIPIWLQSQPPADWPVNAQRIPIEELEAKYGTYWASGPAYELMHLYHRGFREFHIYGIHLATEREYVEQRPNWEFLLGRLLGVEVQMSEAKDLRTYTGSNGVTVVMPKSCPILTHRWKYAYEPRPEIPADPYAAEWAAMKQEKETLKTALILNPKSPQRHKMIERLKRLEIIEIDIQQMRAKRGASATLTCEVAA